MGAAKQALKLLTDFELHTTCKSWNDIFQTSTREMKLSQAGQAHWRAAVCPSRQRRFFSATPVRAATWGFIGLGAMGKTLYRVEECSKN
jgi:hypothetical protein